MSTAMWRIGRMAAEAKVSPDKDIRDLRALPQCDARDVGGLG
jgi:hypothetical protein